MCKYIVSFKYTFQLPVCPFKMRTLAAYANSSNARFSELISYIIHNLHSFLFIRIIEHQELAGKYK